MDPSGSARLTAPAPLEGQVCDRCRQKKIKCDGLSAAMSSCSNCTLAGVQCEVSANLRRKAKFRGYSAPSDVQQNIERLEHENALLRSQLQAESETVQSLRKELDKVSQQALNIDRPHKLRKVGDRTRFTGLSTGLSPSVESDSSKPNRPALVVKHMGRMVHDQAGVGKFAGSTTGVHFVSSVEDLCRKSRPHLKAFPEDCFRLHIIEPRFHAFGESLGIASSNLHFPNITIGSNPKSMYAMFAMPLEYYISQLDTFNETWVTFCPILPRAKFAGDLERAHSHLRAGLILDSETSPAIQTLIMILLINRHSTDEADVGYQESSNDQKYLALACELHHQIVARGDLSSLQALVLFSFYLQITNQTSWFTQLNGVQVRIAQSLGMHRHARRFRFTESETELRKRLWWWVYSFDKLTSLIHGMPQLIQDYDVDNDLPIDCELLDLSASALSYPLPGEPSPVSLYIHYIHLTKIFALILSQLYTTTQRRDAVVKLPGLDRDLLGWHRNFSSALQMSSDIWDVEKTLSKARMQRSVSSESSMIAWMDLLANYALILIHRPALTFDSSTQAFREALNKCMKASATIIQLASGSHFHYTAVGCAPLGPGVIFQSALIHVLHACRPTIATISGHQDEDHDQEHAVVVEAILLLKSMNEHGDSAPLQKDSIGPAIPILETLLAEFFQSNHAAPNPQPVFDASTTGALRSQNAQFAGMSIPIATPQILQEDTASLDFWNTSALESLNNLDFLDISNYDMNSPYEPTSI